MASALVWVCPPTHPKGVPPSTKAGCVHLKGLIDTGAGCSAINLKKVPWARKGRRCTVFGACKTGGAAYDTYVHLAPKGCPPMKVCAAGTNGRPVVDADVLVGFDYMKKARLWIKVASTGKVTLGCGAAARAKSKVKPKAKAKPKVKAKVRPKAKPKAKPRIRRSR